MWLCTDVTNSLASPSTHPRPPLFPSVFCREPFIGLLEQSVRQLGTSLSVVGDGGYFKGYGWKLKEVRNELIRQQHDFDIVLFTDSFVRNAHAGASANQL